MTSSPWTLLHTVTQARIGLDRSGNALTTDALLDFQAAQALARDAVYTALDEDLLRRQLPVTPIVVHSAAPDRRTYLQRPDLGRRLDQHSRDALSESRADIGFVLADGLAAEATHRYAVDVLTRTLSHLRGLTVAPTVIAHQARVALGDDVGAALGVRLVVVLLGERPGLTAPDSMSAYLTFGPRPGRRDSERNCISNIRAPGGRSPADGALIIATLTRAALSRQLTGVDLKDDTTLGISRQVGVDGRAALSAKRSASHAEYRPR